MSEGVGAAASGPERSGGKTSSFGAARPSESSALSEGVGAGESSALSARTVQTDEQLLAIDIAAALVDGRQTAEAAVAAAIRADRIGVQPRSLTFLAEVVRRGGLPYAVRLPEQSALVRPWMEAAGERSDAFARWLDAVATALEARRAVRLNEP
jgi:hypothetical protein